MKTKTIEYSESSNTLADGFNIMLSLLFGKDDH